MASVTDQQKQESHDQYDFRIQIVEVLHLMPFQFAGTHKRPEMTQMV